MSVALYKVSELFTPLWTDAVGPCAKDRYSLMNSLAPPSLLVVDDDPSVAEFIHATATDAGFNSTATDNLDVATLGSAPDLIILDLQLPGKDGVELIRELGASNQGARIFLVSGLGRRILATASELATKKGLRVMGALSKPLSYQVLLDALVEARHKLAARAPLPPAPPLGIGPEELEAALERKEIEAVFQPIVDVTTGYVVAGEALARWRHPTLGLLPPSKFVPLAEKHGLIAKVDWAVLSSVVDFLRRIGSKQCVPMSVNFSAREFSDLTLPDRVSALLRRVGVRHDFLNIELTESAMIKDLSRTLDSMMRLRMKGVGLWLDDFGTGYSSMEQLRRLPLSAVKLDISFMPTESNWDANLALLQGLVEMARHLRLPMIAEGVETPRQLEMLWELGCQQAQGFYLGRPMSPDVFLDWIDSRPA